MKEPITILDFTKDLLVQEQWNYAYKAVVKHVEEIDAAIFAEIRKAAISQGVNAVYLLNDKEIAKALVAWSEQKVQKGEGRNGL